MNSIRIAVLGGRDGTCAAITSHFTLDPSIDFAGRFADVTVAQAHLARFRPDVIVLFDTPDSAEACREILNRNLASGVVVLARNNDARHVYECLRAGARGYVQTDEAPADLARAAHSVARGETVLAPGIAHLVLAWARRARSASGSDTLTPREITALSLAANGLTNREMARRMSMSQSSIKLCIRRAADKLGAADRGQAVAAGIRKGLI